MIDKNDRDFSVRKQCALLGLSRSVIYYQSEKKSLERRQEIIETLQKIHDNHPYYGARRLHYEVLRLGYSASIYQIRELMKEIGIIALCPRKRMTKANKQHKKYPYLLRGVTVVRPNQVWATDITYLRINGGYVYMMAIIDLFSRKILSWGISNTQDAGFCVGLLSEALRKYGKPEIFNSDQGSQYTSNAFTALLEANGIRISMDGVGRALDNIFIERFWKTLKYEDFFIRDYRSLKECREGIKRYIDFYNQGRPHQSLDSLTPDEVYKRGVVIFFNFTARSYLPHYSWSGCFSLMENMDFKECVFIFKNGYSREKYLELKAA